MPHARIRFGDPLACTGGGHGGGLRGLVHAGVFAAGFLVRLRVDARDVQVAPDGDRRADQRDQRHPREVLDDRVGSGDEPGLRRRRARGPADGGIRPRGDKPGDHRCDDGEQQRLLRDGDHQPAGIDQRRADDRRSREGKKVRQADVAGGQSAEDSDEPRQQDQQRWRPDGQSSRSRTSSGVRVGGG